MLFFTFTHKSDSPAEPDTAFTGETHWKTFLFQLLGTHTLTVNNKLFSQHLICKTKLKTQFSRHQRPQFHRKAANITRNAGETTSNTLLTGKKITERGQTLLKQLSTQILINLGLCCHMGSWTVWQKSNTATEIEVNIKREGALDYEYSECHTASPACTEEQRFHINSSCFHTTPWQPSATDHFQCMVTQITALLLEWSLH